MLRAVFGGSEDEPAAPLEPMTPEKFRGVFATPG
jgi:hypothetical protein